MQFVANPCLREWNDTSGRLRSLRTRLKRYCITLILQYPQTFQLIKEFSEYETYIPEIRDYSVHLYGTIKVQTRTSWSESVLWQPNSEANTEIAKLRCFWQTSAKTFLLSTFEVIHYPWPHIFCARIIIAENLRAVSRKAVTQPPSSKGTSAFAACNIMILPAMADPQEWAEVKVLCARCVNTRSLLWKVLYNQSGRTVRRRERNNAMSDLFRYSLFTQMCVKVIYVSPLSFYIFPKNIPLCKQIVKSWKEFANGRYR